MEGSIVSSSGAEQWHGIFDYLGYDEEGKEHLYLEWVTSKVIGYEVKEPFFVDPKRKSEPTEKYKVYPIILNRPEPGNCILNYYIQDSNGLHPSEDLGRRTCKTIEEAKDCVMNHFKKKYPKHSILWADELGLDNIRIVSRAIEKRKRAKKILSNPPCPYEWATCDPK